MIPRLIDAKYTSKYRVWLKFDDGRQGEVDLEDELWGEVFEPLKKKNSSKRLLWIKSSTPSSGKMALILHPSSCTKR